MSDSRKRKLDKSTLAQTFRFDCDRFLRFRLATAKERDDINLGDDSYNRPGINQIRAAGRRWEADQYEHLVAELDGTKRIRYERQPKEDPTAKRKLFQNVEDLRDQLELPTPPEILIEAQYDLLPSAAPGLEEAHQKHGLDDVKMRPDILWIRPIGTGSPLIGGPPSPTVEYEIHVIDVKMVAEPNLRHFTEVTYYALALQEIIKEWKLQHRYAVSAQGFIWPGSREPHRFRDLMLAHKTDAAPLTSTLQEILLPIPYEVYQVHVREFFQSRLLPVLDTKILETAWHVQPSCALCDYLKFCRKQAADDDHLSRIAWLSRGQAETLRQNGIQTTSELATAILDNLPSWQSATASNQQLRANAPALLGRADALKTQSVVIAAGRKAASMPKATDMNIFLTVHSDPGSGLVFAIGVNHLYWYPGRDEKAPPRRDDKSKVFVVTSVGDFKNDKTMRSDNERQKLVEFLDTITPWLSEVDAHNQAVRAAYTGTRRKIPGQKTVHFFVWDAFEIKQLRRLIERHMDHPDVRGKIDLLLRYFPPDSVLPSDPDAYRSQPGTAVKDVFKLLVGVPVAHDYTLLDVASTFHPWINPATGKPKRFWVEYGFNTPLSDQIPFERAYELWTNKVSLTRRDPKNPKSDGRVLTWNEVYQGLIETVDTRLRALDEVVNKLRKEYGVLLTLHKAPFSVASKPQINVPEAGRQLNTLEKLDEATRDIENRALRALPVEEREARFHSMRDLRLAPAALFADNLAALRGGTTRLSTADLYVFYFPTTSADVRIKEGAFTLALSNQTNPIDDGAEPIDLDVKWPPLIGMEWEDAPQAVIGAGLDAWLAFVAVKNLLGVEVVQIESSPPEGEPFIVLTPRFKPRFDFAVQQGLIDLSKPLVLDPIHEDNSTAQIERVLKAVGRPAATKAKA